LAEDIPENNCNFFHNFSTSITERIGWKMMAWGPNGPHVSTDC